MANNRIRVSIASDAEHMAEEAAERIVAAAQDAFVRQETFSLVLSGGSTPRLLHQRLASAPVRPRIDWQRVEFFFGDERCVPPDHADSNFRMARETLLEPLAIPEARIHRMRGEIEPEKAAIEYGQMLKSRFGDGGPDVVLLGMGDDGHTASLFPGTTALSETHHRCVAVYVDKLKVWRVTMTAPFINRAREVMVLVCGGNKTSRVAEVLEGPDDPMRLPIQLIQPASKGLVWLLDAAAAGMALPPDDHASKLARNPA